MQNNYTLYITNKLYSSWSLRPWLLLKELGIPFEEVLTPMSPEGSSADWKSFRKFSPSGKVPTLKAENTVVWDSLAITEFVAEQHKSVWPEAPEARAFARSASAEMHSGFHSLRSQCPMRVGLSVQMKSISPELKKDIERIDELWADGLSRFGGPFLAGKNFSAIDAFFAPVCFRIQSYGLQLSSASTAYYKRILALPSMLLWKEQALAEPFTEPAHEAEAAAAGKILADDRANLK